MDIRGKKHICPFCNAMFYDMNKEIVNCPKCKKVLSKDDELEFIKKKKKAEVKLKDEDRIIDSIDVDDGDMDLSDSEMFFDMENDETISSKSYNNDDEDY